MKKYLKINLYIILLIFSGVIYGQKYNSLIDQNFWSKKPTVKTVSEYILNGNSVLETNTKGLTVLQIAIYNKVDLSIVKLLLENGASVNRRDVKGNTALTYAIKYGSLEVLSYLIKKGANITIVNNKGNDLGAILVVSYHENDISLFVEKINLLINNGYDPMQAKVQNGNSLLQVAVRSKNPKVLEYILKMNIPVDLVNKQGYSPLHVAVMTGKDDLMIKQLIQAGASKTIRTYFGETAYDLAKENENFKNNNININQLK